MGHRIEALVIVGSVDKEKANEFDVKLVPCRKGFSLIALDPQYVDHWEEELDIHGDRGRYPICNSEVVHYIASQISTAPTYALIMTDYFGGRGVQAAAVYKDGHEIMAPAVSTSGVINRALRLLGVKRGLLADEFASLGLQEYRDFDDLFVDYY